MKQVSGMLVALMVLVLVSCTLQPSLNSGAGFTPTPSATVTPTNEGSAPRNCTYTQGYWKNHPTAWPITELALGSVTYDQEEIIAILHTSPRGDATYILVHQLIAAKLNIGNGADGTAIADTVASADEWLIDHPLGSNPSSVEREEGIALANTLDDYNNGLLGPGPCDDATATPSATLTPTPTVSTTHLLTATPSPTPPIIGTPSITDCVGADPHPKGTELANRYDVAYEEIMGWFCSRFGFGEIERAYDLSRETGTPVNEIFALKQEGMGWGEIRDRLGASPSNRDDTKEKEKDKSK